MKATQKTFSVIIGFILLGGLGIGGYFVLTFFMELFRRMDLQVTAVTDIASVVALLAALILASSIRQVGKQNTTNQLHPEKAATYQRCIDLWEDSLWHGRDANDRSPDTLSEQLLALDHRLMLYGSAGVVKAYAALRALERESGAHNPRVQSQVATVLMEMRQDLGAETRGLSVEDLLPLLPADADQAASPPANVSAYRDLTPRVSLASRS